MCGGVHYGEVGTGLCREWPCSRGASCVVEYTTGRLGLVSVERWPCSRGVSCVVDYTMGRLRDWSL